MIQRYKRLLLWCMFVLPHMVCAASLKDLATSAASSGTPQVEFLVGHDEKQQLQNLQKQLEAELKTLQKDTEKFLVELKEARDKTRIRLEKVHAKAQQGGAYTNDSSLAQKATLFNRLQQTLIDMREMYLQVVETVKNHAEFLKKYSGEGNTVFDSQRIDKKAVYSFSDLQKATKLVTDQKEVIVRLQSKKTEQEEDVAQLDAQLKEKERKIKEVQQQIAQLQESADPDVAKKLELHDIEKHVLEKEKHRLEITKTAHVRRIEFYNSEIYTAQELLRKFQDDLMLVRSRIKVTQKDVSSYNKKNLETKHAVHVKKIQLHRLRSDLAAQKSAARRELDKKFKEYKGSITKQALQNWNITRDTFDDMLVVAQLAAAESKVAILERKIESVKAQIAVEDAKEKQAQAVYNAVVTLYQITHRELRTIEQLEAAKKEYRELERSMNAEIKRYKDLVVQAHEFVKQQHKALNNIKERKEHITQQMKGKSSVAHDKARLLLKILQSASKSIEEQNGVTLTISELYASAIDYREKTVLTASFILQELEALGVWQRSNRAVTLNGIKQIIPNLFIFIQNVRTVLAEYFASFETFKVFSSWKYIASWNMVYLVMLCFMLFLFYFVLQSLLPYLYHLFIATSASRYSWLFISRFFAVFIGFLYTYFTQLYVFVALLVIAHFYQLSVALLLLVYIATTLYLLYVSRLFLRYFLRFNKDANYVLLGEGFQERFAWVFSFFAYSTIFLLMLRKMFLLVMLYQQSEFPNILLRLYHVVIFLSLMFVLDREEVMHYIQRHVKSLRVIAFISQYYYLLLGSLFMLLILSDPYLGGYGTLVWYVAWNVGISFLIILGLYIIHRFVKKHTSFIFFKEDDDALTVERFSGSRTWFGLYVIALFAVFALFAVVFVARVWGHVITFDLLHSYLDKGVFAYNYHLESGQLKSQYVTIGNILEIIAICLSGLLIARLFNRFVLKRIFALQYVDPSIQNALSIISRYIIIIGMILVAFIRADLTFLVGYTVGIALITFGWSFRDLFTDIVAYFFILVQRPIKIGDYVRLDNDTMGVVRKISPRAVLLRRKNSVMIVVPNSYVLKTAVYNWNYVRGFVAFEDILFSVPYSSDPKQVRQILYRVVDEHPEILKVPAPIIRLQEFGDKGFVFLIRGFVSSGNTLEMWDISGDLKLKIVEALREEGIRIAEPVLRIRMKDQ